MTMSPNNFNKRSIFIAVFTLRMATISFADTLSSSDDSSGDFSLVSLPERQQLLESKAESKATNLHKIDTFNLMLYTFLLILTVCTVWLFKHRRLRFVHETGLTLIYGLIVGLIIWLTSADAQKKYLKVIAANQSEKIDVAPDFLRLSLPSAVSGPNKSATFFRYKFDGEEQKNGDQQYDSLMEMKATFDPEVFFDVLLPPIMFNAGYSLKRRHFFRNIGSILMFAIAGTTVSCVVVGLVMYGVTLLAHIPFSLGESMLFGSLISATDPVTVLAIFNDIQVENDLFAIVFGESALNDAVAIVLFRTIEGYAPSSGGNSTIDTIALLKSAGNFFGGFLGSISLGALAGCSAALLMKFTKIRDFPLLETSLFVLISYMSFLTAEAAGMTGVVAALFCGICQAHYTYNNLSEESQTRTKQFFDVLNFLSENFIFTYIGVSLFTSKAHVFNWWFILGAFLAIAVGRAAHVYPFSLILNLARRPKIPCRHMHMMMFAGLRGAVAFALAIRNTATEQRRLIYTATALIVIFTVVVNGGMTIPLIDWLKIKHGPDQETELQNTTGSGSQQGRSPSTGEAPHHNPWDKALLPRQWYNFDRSFLKPLLTNSRPTLVDTCPQCCLPLARLLTTTEQMSTALGPHSRTNSEGELFADSGHEDIENGPTTLIHGTINGSVETNVASERLPSRGPSSTDMTSRLVRSGSSNGGSIV